MGYTITRLTDAAFDLLTDDEITEWVRLDPDTDALTLSMLMASATAYVEAATSQTLAQCSFRVDFDDDACTSYRLPVYPVQTVTAVTSLDADGVAQPVTYTRRGNTIVLASYPAGPVSVTLVGGYIGDDTIPAPLKHAVAVLISAGYDDRTGITEAVQKGVDRLLIGQRRGGWLG